MERRRRASDVETMRRFVERRDSQRARLLDKRFAEATRDLERIADYLIREYHPRRIYQWDSLIKRKRFSSFPGLIEQW